MTKEKQDFFLKKATAEVKKHEKPIAMVLDVLFLSDLTLSSQDD